MRIVITGGCGFVGFSLARYLREIGHQITVFDNLVRRGSEINVPALLKMGTSFVHGDIRNTEDLAQLSSKADCLIECSAQPSVVSGYVNPVYDFTTNVTGVIHCLELCRARAMGMVFLSSSRVYPASKINAIPVIEKPTRWDWGPGVPWGSLPHGFDPVRGISAQFTLDGPTKTIYGASKAAADLFCQEYADAFDLPVIVNRCGVISGEGQFGVMNQGWLAFWAISCFLERPIQYLGFKGKQVRDILFAQDLCTLVAMQLDKLELYSGRVWNVGGGRDNSLSLVEATALLEQIMAKKMLVSHSSEVRKSDMIIYITDNSEVSRDVGWAPSVSIEEGAGTLARWVRDNHEALEQYGL
jgi:CDP-paratose 2-epimerase